MPHKRPALRDILTFPADPSVTTAPALPHRGEWLRAVSAAVRRSKRRITMMSALATGWLPWGVEWTGDLPLCFDYSDAGRPIHPRFILCCGHSMKPKEAQLFVDHGLLTAGPDRAGAETLVITDAGKAWLSANW